MSNKNYIILEQFLNNEITLLDYIEKAHYHSYELPTDKYNEFKNKIKNMVNFFNKDAIDDTKNELITLVIKSKNESEELTDPIDLKQSKFNKLDQKLREDIEVFNNKFKNEDRDNREMITIDVKYVGDIATLTIIHFKGYNVLAYGCIKYNIIQDLVN